MEANAKTIIRHTKWKVRGYCFRFWTDWMAMAIAAVKQKPKTTIGNSRLCRGRGTSSESAKKLLSNLTKYAKPKHRYVMSAVGVLNSTCKRLTPAIIPPEAPSSAHSSRQLFPPDAPRIGSKLLTFEDRLKAVNSS
ncbi:hypothetical protein Acr_05g0005490 [Actinidia rufa]|uniref:Uncharacterized protein n=1 Tax=Actinidia rufa TaxID=165716 RepID=A0A7J0EKJ7_9ERIC|nr:hypothetical protein Acr_05g0005490 [Actinidia rufa]